MSTAYKSQKENFFFIDLNYTIRLPRTKMYVFIKRNDRNQNNSDYTVQPVACYTE